MRNLRHWQMLLMATAVICCLLSADLMADLIITSGTEENPNVISTAQDLSQTASPYILRVGTSAGSGALRIDSGGSVYNSVSDTGCAIIGSSGEGLLILNGGTLYSAQDPRTIRAGSAGGVTGALKINSGTAYVTYLQVGYGDSWGEVTINGGTLSAVNGIRIGVLAGGYIGGGYVKLAGGTITTAGHVSIGCADGTQPCTLEISGGTFTQAAGLSNLYVGSSNSAGTLHVNGSGATSITVADRIRGYAGQCTMKFTIDAGGITPISVNYTYSDLNGTVDMELASGVTPSVNDTFDLIVTRTGTMTSNLTLAEEDEDLWQLEVVGGTTLRAKYLGPSGVEPPVADAGSDAAAEDTDDDGYVTVTLDGTASTDDAGIVSYVWFDYDGTQIATGATANVSLPVGQNDIKLVVTDGNSQSDSDVVRIWTYPKVDYWVDGTNGDNGNNGTSEQTAWATINYAVDHVSAGKVIMVKEGIYREYVTLGVSGTAGSPITLMGEPFSRVVVSGADVVTGWTQCTSVIAAGNPNYASIYYTDLAWKPTRVIQDGEELAVSQIDGWFVCTGGTSTTLVDTNNLTQADDYWNGATMRRWNYHPRQVTDFVAATSTVTVDPAFSGEAPIGGETRYSLSHIVQLIDGQGQWAVKDLGGGTYRLFVWAAGGGTPGNHLMEVSRRTNYAINTSEKIHWIIDNIEARHVQGHGIGNGGNSANAHIVIRNCTAHGNDSNGINGRFTDGTLRRNLAFNNGNFGFNTFFSDRLIIEENEIAFNNDDGLEVTGTGDPQNWNEDIIVRRNSIHNHMLYGHPDSTMIWNYIRNVLVEDNLLYGAGQHAMIRNIDGLTMTNNVMHGSYACSLILGGPFPADLVTRNNTITMSSLTPIAHSSDIYDHANNIIAVGNTRPCWANVDATTNYTSDYNQFWHGPGLTATPVVWDDHYGWTLAQYVADSGQDTHSSYSDPHFANAPMYLLPLDAQDRQDEFTTTKVYVWGSYVPDYFAVGDKVEINCDGIVRTVTAIGSDYVSFTPGDDYIAFKANTIANWGDNSDFRLDLTPAAAITGDDAQPVGSKLNVQNYMSGDFNGDGRRDVPDWPTND